MVKKKRNKCILRPDLLYHYNAKMKGTHFERGCESGSSLVEAAIIFPVLVLLFFGFIQYAVIFSNEIALRNALAVGTRTALNLGFKTETEGDIAESITGAISPVMYNENLSIQLTRPSSSLGKIRLTYTMPLFFPAVVPGRVGGVKDLVEEATVPL